MYYNEINATAVTVLGLYFTILGVFVLGWIASFVFRGIGMYKIGKAQGRTNAWIAFLPFVRTYFQGELSGEILLKKRKMKSPGVWLLLAPFIYGIIFVIMYFILMISVVATVFSTIKYEGMEVNDSDLSGIITVFIISIIVILIVSLIYAAIKGGLQILVNRQIYERYTTVNMATLHAVFSMIIPLYESVCMFIFGRKAEQMMENNIQQNQMILEEEE
ncbi:hypothetical protein [Faecalimonas sp.]